MSLKGLQLELNMNNNLLLNNKIKTIWIYSFLWFILQVNNVYMQD